MRLISWFLTLVILTAALCFAGHNGQQATINLWPFNAQADIPFYVVPLATLFFGFLAGLTVGWIGHIPHRMEKRRLRRDLAAAQRKLEELRGSVSLVGKSGGGNYISWARNRLRWRNKRP
jgi:uncharacterized integral membrane protein